MHVLVSCLPFGQLKSGQRTADSPPRHGAIAAPQTQKTQAASQADVALATVDLVPQGRLELHVTH